MKNINIESLVRCCENRTGHHFTFVPDYVEPGYHSPEKGIVLGNWNPVCGFSKTRAEQARDPVSKLARVLEAAGYECEWEDEWSTCTDCGNAVRTAADSYGWTAYWRIVDCDFICLGCLDVATYLESIEDDPKACCAPSHNPKDHGYVKFNGDFESGWHPGQDDDPKKIMAHMHAQGLSRVVFKLASAGQFDARWHAYYKP